MDYVRAGDPPSRIAEDLDLSEDQVRAALDDINAHRDEVEAQDDAILSESVGRTPTGSKPVRGDVG